MNKNTKYKLFKLLNALLAMLLAASVVCVVVASTMTGVLKSQGFLEKKLQTYSAQTAQQLTDEFVKLSDKTGFSQDAYKNAFTANDTQLIFKTVAGNFQLFYSTEFSDDSDLYNCIKTRLTNYCEDNGLNYTDREISNNAALCVDTVNQIMGGSSTKIRVFGIVKSNIMIYAVVAPIILAIACIVALDLLNYGRHRKYNYIGLGFSTAGFVLASSGVFIRLQNYSSQYSFCDNKIYSAAVSDCFSFFVNICIALGVAFAVVGVVILAANLAYYTKKERRIKAVHEENSQLRSEYMEQISNKPKNNSSNGSDKEKLTLSNK